MKLPVRRTVLIGMAFMAINAFWALYEFAVPLILRNTYQLGDTLAGVVMAMDNIVALLLLPLFGSLSDNCRHPWGRRMPFIFFGSLTAAALTLAVPLVVRFGNLAAFLTLLGLLLLTMSVFRSPTVALMPDITPRPLRSRGNAVINLMGAIGSALSLLMVNFLVRERVDAAGSVTSDYTGMFVMVAAVMIISAVVVKLTTPERRLAALADEQNRLLNLEPEAAEASNAGETGRLNRDELRSLILLLLTSALLFMGYNALTSALSKYATIVWGVTDADAANCVLVGAVGAIISYWPIGQLSSRFGRKRMTLIGIALLTISFFWGALMRRMRLATYVMFLVIGFGWACIGVNGYPMVVEMASGADVGRYTGIYYTFTMTAQVLTPVFSGALLEHVGYWTLFPYSLVMVALAMVTMIQVRHGDSRPAAPRGLEALNMED